MDKIKPSMIALGNNLIQGGLLAVGSAYFDDSPKRTPKSKSDERLAEQEQDLSFEKRFKSILRNKSNNYDVERLQGNGKQFLLFSSPPSD